MFHRYRYEEEYYNKLNRLPLDVRHKLDISGIKLPLKIWQGFSFEERNVLCHLPCDTTEEVEVFSDYIDFLSRRDSGQPCERCARLDAVFWESSTVPQPVLDKSAALNSIVTLDQWCRWPSHDRYALYKTALSQSQPEAFEQVLKQVRLPTHGR